MTGRTFLLRALSTRGKMTKLSLGVLKMDSRQGQRILFLHRLHIGFGAHAVFYPVGTHPGGCKAAGAFSSSLTNVSIFTSSLPYALISW
jgi:hypothetical protein